MSEQIVWIAAYVGIFFTLFSVSGATLIGVVLLLYTLTSTSLISHRKLTLTPLLLQKIIPFFIAALVLTSWFIHGDIQSTLPYPPAYAYKPLFLAITLPSFTQLSEKHHKKLLLSLLALSTAAAIYATGVSCKGHFQIMGHLPFLGPQESAGVLTVLLVFELMAAIYLVEKEKIRWMLILSAIIKSGAVILTFSRTYFIFLPVIWIYYFYRSVKEKVYLPTVTAAFVLIISAAGLLLYSGMKVEVENIFSSTYQTNFMRLCMWRVGIKKIIQSPLLGPGGQYFPDEFVDDLKKEKNCASEVWDSVRKILHDPHNAYITLGLYGGAAAMLLYFVFVCVTFFRTLSLKPSCKTESWLKVSLLLSFVALFIFGGTFDRHPVGDPVLAVLTGILTGIIPDSLRRMQR